MSLHFINIGNKSVFWSSGLANRCSTENTTGQAVTEVNLYIATITGPPTHCLTIFMLLFVIILLKTTIILSSNYIEEYTSELRLSFIPTTFLLQVHQSVRKCWDKHYMVLAGWFLVR